ncbi:hypothetical protein [Streptomyces buecherae]|uniref:Syndecan 1 n=1 Tax=Streptomyces buecherae TaxID=2763006 RepID=A0A7H8NG44_9ACTN|nr:hypothetical protein [Streptomyces buecherae]QKW53467.1 hypothetical protein HUT08_32365 [Streptomyces buecherae]
MLPVRTSAPSDQHGEPATAPPATTARPVSTARPAAEAGGPGRDAGVSGRDAGASVTRPPLGVPMASLPATAVPLTPGASMAHAPMAGALPVVRPRTADPVERPAGSPGRAAGPAPGPAASAPTTPQARGRARGAPSVPDGAARPRANNPTAPTPRRPGPRTGLGAPLSSLPPSADLSAPVQRAAKPGSRTESQRAPERSPNTAPPTGAPAPASPSPAAPAPTAPPARSPRPGAEATTSGYAPLLGGVGPRQDGEVRREGPRTYGVTMSPTLVQRVVAPVPTAPASRLARSAASTTVAPGAPHGPGGRAVGEERTGPDAGRPATRGAAPSAAPRAGGRAPLVTARPVPRAGGASGGVGEPVPRALPTTHLSTARLLASRPLVPGIRATAEATPPRATRPVVAPRWPRATPPLTDQATGPPRQPAPHAPPVAGAPAPVQRAPATSTRPGHGTAGTATFVDAPGAPSPPGAPPLVRPSAPVVRPGTTAASVGLASVGPLPVTAPGAEPGAARPPVGNAPVVPVRAVPRAAVGPPVLAHRPPTPSTATVRPPGAPVIQRAPGGPTEGATPDGHPPGVAAPHPARPTERGEGAAQQAAAHQKAAPPPGPDMDELARRLLDPVARLLRTELRRGRERAGRPFDGRR